MAKPLQSVVEQAVSTATSGQAVGQSRALVGVRCEKHCREWLSRAPHTRTVAIKPAEEYLFQNMGKKKKKKTMKKTPQVSPDV